MKLLIKSIPQRCKYHNLDRLMCDDPHKIDLFKVVVNLSHDFDEIIKYDHLVAFFFVYCFSFLLTSYRDVHGDCFDGKKILMIIKQSLK